MKSALIAAIAAMAAASIAPAAGAAAVCTDQHAPVCGLVKPTGPQTFDNACRAKLAGAPILHMGECVGDGEKRCNHILTPVCARAAGADKAKTYDNLCWAEKDWAVVLHKGRCA